MEVNEKYIRLACEVDPLFIRKRRNLSIAFALRMFLIGVEYSVILPSVLLYMDKLKVSAVVNGLVIAAYPCAGMLALPVFGRIFDRTKRTRELIFLLNTFQIVGNVIYAIPLSPWLPLSGRFVAGLGDGFLACAAGEIMHVYPMASRTGIISLLELGRLLGLIIGPAVNFFIDKKTYFLRSWRLDYATLPGVIMAFGWLIMQFVTICLVSNLSKQMSEAFNAKNKEENKTDELDFTRFDEPPRESVAWTFDDTFYLMENEEKDDGRGTRDDDSLSSGEEDEKEIIPINSALKEFFTPDFLILAYVIIVLWTSQTEFEILLPYITEFNYGWSAAWTGVIYMIGGVGLILIFVTLYVIDKYYPIRDTYLLLISLFLTQISLGLIICEAVLMKYRKIEKSDPEYRIIVFGFICFLVFSSIPFNVVGSKSLISKIAQPQSQGFIQGIYASVTRVALIVGPIIGSLVFDRREQYGIVASVVCIIAIFGLMLCMKRIHRKEDNNKETVDINDFRTHLDFRRVLLDELFHK